MMAAMGQVPWNGDSEAAFLLQHKNLRARFVKSAPLRSPIWCPSLESHELVRLSRQACPSDPASRRLGSDRRRPALLSWPLRELSPPPCQRVAFADPLHFLLHQPRQPAVLPSQAGQAAKTKEKASAVFTASNLKRANSNRRSRTSVTCFVSPPCAVSSPTTAVHGPWPVHAYLWSVNGRRRLANSRAFGNP